MIDTIIISRVHTDPDGTRYINIPKWINLKPGTKLKLEDFDCKGADKLFDG